MAGAVVTNTGVEAAAGVALMAKLLPVDVALSVRSMLNLPLVGVTVLHPAGASTRMT